VQNFAALIVIQAVIVVLPTTIKSLAMAQQIRETFFAKGADQNALGVLIIAANLLTMIFVAVILIKVTRGATKRFGALRKEVIKDLKSLDTVDAVLAQDEAKRGEDLRKWRFFYAAFCMQVRVRAKESTSGRARERSEWKEGAKQAQRRCCCRCCC
jgi:hypothetical protein